MPESLTQAAAGVYALVTLGAVAFQIGLALGAPWGAYAMGGAFPGTFPPRLRVAAAAQAVILAGLAVIVAHGAGVVAVPALDGLAGVILLPVAFAATSLVLNAISRSPGERRIWVPVAIALLASSLVVALAGGPGA